MAEDSEQSFDKLAATLDAHHEIVRALAAHYSTTLDPRRMALALVGAAITVLEDANDLEAAPSLLRQAADAIERPEATH